MAKKAVKKVGRPTTFDPDQALKICEALANGDSLRKICSAPDMPNHTTVIAWVLRDEGGIYDQYAKARQIQAWAMFDEMVEIADDDSMDTITQSDADGNIIGQTANTARLRRDEIKLQYRKWHLSHVLPKSFALNKHLNSVSNQVNVITTDK